MNLKKFLEAQESSYAQALNEVRNKQKRSHWIWWIFPQMKGLGHSYNSNYYGINSLEEARAYLNHPILGNRLREITKVLLNLTGKTAKEVFGTTDAIKVLSCMRLFDKVSEDNLFRNVIDRYFNGKADIRTLQLLRESFTDILLGAVAGDVIGSVYEFLSTKDYDFRLFCQQSRFTDDTVMTVANAKWLLTGDSLSGIMQNYGNRYPNAGYGKMFMKWLKEKNPQPYGSFGNGSAMRVSPVGWAFDTLEETLDAARKSAEVTHDHPEGIKGAQAVAACIYMARTGKSKTEIKEYVEETFEYDLSRTCDMIRPAYSFNTTCQGSVPESVIAFLESTDYESAVRLAVSLGGDADTMGAIAGGIAEAYYGSIPEYIREEVIMRLPDEFIRTMRRFHRTFVSKTSVKSE